jgi:hypothetical protein
MVQISPKCFSIPVSYLFTEDLLDLDSIPAGILIGTWPGGWRWESNPNPYGDQHTHRNTNTPSICHAYLPADFDLTALSRRCPTNPFARDYFSDINPIS